jgi:hypothetical protein
MSIAAHDAGPDLPRGVDLPHHHGVADLIEHMEAFLGPIRSGAPGDESTPPGVQVVLFANDVPSPGVVTLSTLGLSHHHLVLPDDAPAHQELLFHFLEADQPRNAIGLLFQLAAEMIERGEAMGHGTIVGPRGRLFPTGSMTALYAAQPVYLRDEFARCPATPPIDLIWLIPITDTEADFARTHGDLAFQHALERENPDLTDPNRGQLHAAH